MKPQNFIFYCFYIASSNAFSLLPSFLDPSSAIIQNEAYDMLELQNEISTIRDKTDDDLLLNPSLKENIVTEPASAVLSHLRSMLDSPFEDAKKYASEKTKELVSNLEHNTNTVIRFTLGGVNLLVDLGIKGSPTRLRNVEQGRSIMEYIGELFALFTSWIASWFVTVHTEKKVNNGHHEKTEKETAADLSKSRNDSSNVQHSKDGKHLGNKTTEDADLTKSKPTVDDKNSKSDNEINSKPHDEVSKKREKKEPILKLTSTEIFTPPKELSAEEKIDVEKARQRITIIEKNIHELEDKAKQHIDDDEKIKLKQLKNQEAVMKKFITLSTSERI